MDKTSKRIIGAIGAVCAIALAGTGYAIYNNSIRNDGMQPLYGVPVIASYNSKFEIFFGKNKSANDTKNLILSINNANNHNRDDNPYKEFDEIIIEGISEQNDINNSKYYTIEPVDYYENGAIKTISIQEQ